jgi:hypothetical protein
MLPASLFITIITHESTHDDKLVLEGAKLWRVIWQPFPLSACLFMIRFVLDWPFFQRRLMGADSIYIINKV